MLLSQLSTPSLVTEPQFYSEHPCVIKRSHFPVYLVARCDYVTKFVAKWKLLHFWESSLMGFRQLAYAILPFPLLLCLHLGCRPDGWSTSSHFGTLENHEDATCEGQWR